MKSLKTIINEAEKVTDKSKISDEGWHGYGQRRTPWQIAITNFIKKDRKIDKHIAGSSIYFYDTDRGVLILKATYGLDPSTIESVHMPPSEGLVGLVLERSAPVQESQMQEHPRFKAFPQTKENSFSSFPLARNF